MPLVDLEVLAKALDVFDEVPSRVLLEARAPTERQQHRCRRWDDSELVAQTYGVDFPAPR